MLITHEAGGYHPYGFPQIDELGQLLGVKVHVHGHQHDARMSRATMGSMGASGRNRRAELRAACAGTKITFLDNDRLDIDEVRFLGCTLWTDFRLPGLTQQQWMAEVERGLNDYNLIRTPNGELRASETLVDRLRPREWLHRELAQGYEGQTVVVTHHAPHPLSIHLRYVGDRLSAGFVSDLSPLLRGADLWLHGHVHDSFDYSVAGCRVVANPAGYVTSGLRSLKAGVVKLENVMFDPGLVIELPA